MRPRGTAYDDFCSRQEQREEGDIGPEASGRGRAVSRGRETRVVGGRVPIIRIGRDSMTGDSPRRLSGLVPKGRKRLFVFITAFVVLAVYAAIPAFAVHNTKF